MIYKIKKRVRANSSTMKLEQQYVVYVRKDKFLSKLFRCWYFKGVFDTHKEASEYIDLLKEADLYICNGGSYI